jgi:hypothetical protein
MNSFDEPSKSIVLTFLETKEDPNNFYLKDNGILENLVEKLKPSTERLTQRRDYQV